MISTYEIGTREALACVLPDAPWPTPTTGDAFVRGVVDVDQPVQTLHYGPPGRPTRDVVTEWLDDVPVAWRTLTEEEYAAALASYGRAIAKWRLNRGELQSLGRVMIRGTFFTEREGSADAIWIPTRKLWHWTRASGVDVDWRASR